MDTTIKNMKIIYLDQFIVGDLAIKEDKMWKDLRDLLEKLAKSGKIISPLSYEHYLESSPLIYPKAAAYDELMNILSNGKCFYHELYITTYLIIAYVRNEEFTQKMFITTGRENIFQNESEIEVFKDINKKLKDVITEEQTPINELKNATRSSKISKSLGLDLLKITKRLPAEYFSKRIEDVLNSGHLIIRGVQTPHGEMPNRIDVIIEYLIRHFKMTKSELMFFYKEIKNNGFDNIPTLDIISSLQALQSVRHNKIIKNDVIDNMRIACGLPISDILFTDKKRKAEIIKLGLDIKYQCKVFAGTPNDISSFSNLLNTY